MKHTTRRLAGAGALASAGAVLAIAATSGTPSVDVAELNPGAAVDRSLCLTVSLRPGIASECGDLRIAHALPQVRILGATHGPVLIYNSQHASPNPVVAADVQSPSAWSDPDSVVGVLRVSGEVRARGSWRGSGWGAGERRRIALAYRGPGEETNLHRYTLDVTFHRGGDSSSARADGALAVVNRAASPFGAGWWLAGLERVVVDPDGDPVMWVGGDGSVRRYNPVPGETGRWSAQALDRPDTLVREGGGFRRSLVGGGRVVFNTRGQHTSTFDRLGFQTAFHYTGERLDSIQMPVTHRPPETPCDTTRIPNSMCIRMPVAVYRHTYHFGYGSDGRIVEVRAPGAARDSARITRIDGPGMLVRSITDPDGTAVRFD
ncbi:MAG TPA: hypothetical protein VF613_03480, partial [Longimicrobium sp.]